MEAFKKVFSPGHSVDDELMYGSGNSAPTTETPHKSQEQKSNVASSDLDNTNSPSSQGGTGPSHLTTSDPSQPQDSASTASIKSGVLGQDREDSKIGSETTNAHSMKDHSKHPVPHHPATETKHFDTRADTHAIRDANPKRHEDSNLGGQAGTYSSYPISKGDTQSRGTEQTPAGGQASTYGSYPTSQGAAVPTRGVDHESTNPASYQQTETVGVYGSWATSKGDNAFGGADNETTGPATSQQPQKSTYNAFPTSQGDNTSHGFDSGATNPAVHQQPETEMTSTSRETGFGSGIAPAAAGYAVASSNNTSSGTGVLDDKYSGAGGRETIGEESLSQPGPNMPGQFPNTDHNNPYSATRLDPRVDSHLKSSNAGSTSIIGAAITTDQDHLAEQRYGKYGSPTDKQGLSGGKTAAEPFAGPKGTSQLLSGVSTTTDHSAGPKGTSEPLKEEDQHQSKAGGLLAAIGLGKHHSKSGNRDEVTQNSPTATTGKLEPDQASHSAVGTSEIAREDESHKGQKTGILGALGLGGLVAKKHADEKPVETPDNTTHEDEIHKKPKGGVLGVLGLGGLAAKKHADEERERSATGTSRESIPTTSYPPGTSLGDRQHPETAVSGYSGQDTITAPSTQAAHQPSSQTAPQASPIGTATYPDRTLETTPSTSHYDTTTFHKPEESHSARNAAIGGATAAGAGAAAIGGYEYSQQRAAKDEQERLEADHAQQKAMEESRRVAEKEQKAHDKAVAKEEKKAEKEHEKAVVKEEKKVEKKHEKAIKKEEKAAEKQHVIAVKQEEKREKEYEKEVAKLEEKREKEHEKEVAKQEKELEKRTDSDEKDKKHGGLLEIFKRRRDSKGNEIEHEDSDQQQQQQQQQQYVVRDTAPAPVTTGAAGIAPENGTTPGKASESSRHSSEEKEKKHGGLLAIFKRRRDSKGNEIDHEEDGHNQHHGVGPTTTNTGLASTTPATHPEHAAQESHPSPRHESNEQEKDKRHSGGILGIFKRRRDSKGNETVHPDDADDSTPLSATTPKHHHHHHPHHDNDNDNRTGTGKHEINKLHKDPPADLLPPTNTYADYAAQEHDHPDAQTATGGYTAPPPASAPGLNDTTQYRGTDPSFPTAAEDSIINRPRGAYDVAAADGDNSERHMRGPITTGMQGTTPISALSVGAGREAALGLDADTTTIAGRPYEEIRGQ